MISIDFHIHSKYSYDSLMNPKKIIRVAKKNGLSGIAITDHGSIQGALETKKLNRDKNFLVIVGMEVATEIGDIIGLFLNRKIKSKNSLEVMNEIHAQGGIIVLPHPCRGHKLDKKILDKIDIVESHNARDKKINTQKAILLSKKYKKPMIGGSDAHFYSEIGAVRVDYNSNDIKKDILKGVLNTKIEYTSKSAKELSQIVKSIKVGRFYRLFLQLPAYFYYLLERN
jgi:predicted metal-dependent phosphoesterase TrpH